ncbi:hypothetical protein DL766_008980 [Monosporascus sp. MC13-8B]|uniref:Uncharacterized protein n=1 Tax=Monosporascus cannonballus TaxID=155416 RepID=A0ABY0GYW5_9PEZI|nr:hypothetical protein DL762_007576 [Monosporascus cannonballus]RYO90071.1 hypothetical protein DL763_005438 [Monosporascus cannonballus]RYP17081.1 hypothetical protein DL766_008980 [Monosporascus sp. MC13-8B]
MADDGFILLYAVIPPNRSKLSLIRTRTNPIKGSRVAAERFNNHDAEDHHRQLEERLHRQNEAAPRRRSLQRGGSTASQSTHDAVRAILQRQRDMKYQQAARATKRQHVNEARNEAPNADFYDYHNIDDILKEAEAQEGQEGQKGQEIIDLTED